MEAGALFLCTPEWSDRPLLNLFMGGGGRRGKVQPRSLLRGVGALG